MLALLTIGLLAGCANQYASSYHDAADLGQRAGILAPYSGETQIIPSTHISADARLWMAKGYFVIGYSSFQSTDWEPDSLRASQAETQAKSVSADIVLVKTKDLGSRSVTVNSAPHLDQTDPAQPGYTSEQLTYNAELEKYSAVFLRKGSNVR